MTEFVANYIDQHKKTFGTTIIKIYKKPINDLFNE